MSRNGGYIGYDATPTLWQPIRGVWGMADVGLARRRGTWPLIAFEDLFDTDTSALYTQIADAAATWTIASGELVGDGGTQAMFTRTGISVSDVAVEADCNHAHDGGLVLRVTDVNNYYLLKLDDDSGGEPSMNLRIFKRVAGTYTTLVQTDISWTRGVSKTVRFEAINTALKAYVDGTQLLSTTDSAHTGPGGIGVRHHSSGTAAKYQALRMWAY